VDNRIRDACHHQTTGGAYGMTTLAAKGNGQSVEGLRSDENGTKNFQCHNGHVSTAGNLQSAEIRQLQDLQCLHATFQSIVDHCSELMAATQKIMRAFPGERRFLPEERDLIDVIAKLIDKVNEYQNSQQPLQQSVDRSDLEQTEPLESDRQLNGPVGGRVQGPSEIRDSIMANVDKILMPTINALGAEVPDEYRDSIAFIRKNLEEITSPFVDQISRKFTNLTAVEISICNMIRDGLTSKEIAAVRGVSPATIARQRERIRKKLGVVNSNVNLATYLRNFLHTRAAETSCDGVRNDVAH